MSLVRRSADARHPRCNLALELDGRIARYGDGLAPLSKDSARGLGGWMDDPHPAMQALLDRRSVGPRSLGPPAPTPEHLRLMVAAALRAPDYGRLRPWRFIAIEGAARDRLGKVFASAFAARNPGADEQQLARERAKPLRAPLVLGLGAVIDAAHPSVRVLDQQLCVAAAAMNLLNAAHILGYAGMWLTGESCRDPVVKQALGLRAEDFMAGWLYLGTATGDLPPVARPEPDRHLRVWEG